MTQTIDLPERKRGDTYTISFTVYDTDGSVLDITGYTFNLTVDTSPTPTDTSNNLFTLNGVIPTGTDGVVRFAPSAAQADQTPATYYYDVQMTDTSSVIRTIAEGEWPVTQDITK